jgi:UDP-2,3-diacylglucosamine pyrophosphatase LpxH
LNFRRILRTGTHAANIGAEVMEMNQNRTDTADHVHYDCIVISDLHLGSDVCQAKLLEEFLIWAVEHCDELVINGDVFDDLNFKRLTKRHFACLKVIRRNTDRDDFRLVWVRGNHDGPIEVISHIVGVEILDEYVFDNGIIRLLILHGDQFDTFTTAYPWLTEIACGIFYYIQKWMPHRAARWVRRISKRWQRNSELIERRAVEYARNRGYRFVTCGHTHFPLRSEHVDVVYVNSGTWTEAPPCPFVVVSGSEVRLEHWPLAGAENEASETVPLRPAIAQESLSPALPAMG